MGYEHLDHTADVGVRAWAPTMGELFTEAWRGVLAVMGHDAGGAEAGRATVALDAPDAPALLVDWLNELLYLFEVRGFVPHVEAISVDPSGRTLEAEVAGPSSEGFVQEGPAVKAATMHGLRVGEDQAWVYLDI
jgi:SHS2 domain-containing protein